MTVFHYAVIGNPVKHSKSPQIHALFARQEKVAIDYQPIAADSSSFIASVKHFHSQGGLGLNVTVPFKIQAYRACHQLNYYAQAAQAVNTISFNDCQGWQGANTDGLGLLRDLTINLGVDLKNKNILVLGAGGAAQGILLPLLQAKPRQLLIANRTPAKAVRLADQFNTEGPVKACGYQGLTGGPFDIVINATSASLSHDLPPVKDTIVSRQSLCYDLAYSDTTTPFLDWAQQQDVQSRHDGMGMLIEQAAESYFIWRGFRPETSRVFKALRA